MSKVTQLITIALLFALMWIVAGNKAEIKSLQVNLAELGEVCQTASTVESVIVITAPEYVEEEK